MTGAILGTVAAYEGWTKLVRATVRMPDGSSAMREIEDHGNAVAVLPYDAERRVAMLVRQFRAPTALADGDGQVLEAPAGILEGPDPAACARREVEEEVGVRLGALEPAPSGWSMPGISTERIHLFLARYTAADRVAAGGGLAQEHEFIEPVEVALDDLARMADDGRLADVKTLLLVQTLRLRHPDLFGPAQEVGPS